MKAQRCPKIEDIAGRLGEMDRVFPESLMVWLTEIEEPNPGETVGIRKESGWQALA